MYLNQVLGRSLHPSVPGDWGGYALQELCSPTMYFMGTYEKYQHCGTGAKYSQKQLASLGRTVQSHFCGELGCTCATLKPAFRDFTQK